MENFISRSGSVFHEWTDLFVLFLVVIFFSFLMSFFTENGLKAYLREPIFP